MIKKGIYIFISCWCLFSLPLSAQTTFQKVYDEYSGLATVGASNTIQETNDKGFILMGYTANYGAGGTDYYLVKVDSLGTAEWTKTYGGVSGEEPAALLYTTDGGYILSGHTHNFGTNSQGDVFVVKTNSSGNMEWSRIIGGTGLDEGCAITETIDGGFVITGRTSSFGVSGTDIYLFKLDNNGNLVWGKTYGGNDSEAGVSLASTADGGLIVTGYTNSYGLGTVDIFLLKTDSLGNLTWFKTYGELDNELVVSVIESVNGGYLMIGNTYPSGLGDTDILLIKTDVMGTVSWAKVYGGADSEVGTSIWENPNGELLMGALTKSNGTGTTNCCIIKADNTGNVLWANTYMKAVFNFGLYGPTILQSYDGGIVLGGIKYNNGPLGEAMFIMKTNSTGTVGCDRLPFSPIVASIIVIDSSYTPGTLVGDTINTPVPTITSPSPFDSLLCDSPYCTFTISLTGYDASVNGSCDGSATVTVSGGVPPYSYSWSTSPAQMDSSATGLCAGTYTVILTDSNECIASNSVTISEPVALGVSKNLLGNKIHIHPNPNTGQFSLEMDLQEQTWLSIKLYHFTGQLIHSEMIDNVTGYHTQHMDLSSYSKGIYYMQIMTEKGVFTRKVIYQ